MKEKIDGRPRSQLPEYRIWLGMKKRCENQRCRAFHRYGGRGIYVDALWQDFAQFYADMGPRPSRLHSIERLDNNGAYSKDNCCWATKSAQANNTRRTRRLTHAKTTMTLAEWAKHRGIHRGTLKGRIQHMPLEKALTSGVLRPQVMFLMYQGEIHSVNAWAKIRGLNPVTLRARLQRGYSVEEALSLPLQRGKRWDLQEG